MTAEPETLQKIWQSRRIIRIAPVGANVLRSEMMGAREPLSKFGSFVGREREFAELRHALDEAREGRRRLFLASGEPRIGKTRLAEEIARDAQGRGMRVGYLGLRKWHGWRSC